MPGRGEIPSRARENPGYDGGVVNDSLVVHAGAIVVVPSGSVASVQDPLVGVLPSDSFSGSEEIPN